MGLKLGGGRLHRQPPKQLANNQFPMCKAAKVQAVNNRQLRNKIVNLKINYKDGQLL